MSQGPALPLTEPAANRYAIEAENLVKRYPRFGSRRDRVAALIGFERHLDATVALDRVSFAIPRGEAFGVVGENGSGKSTLMKLVSGITEADSGSLSVSPPVSAILELGLGFHPEFTGRQNAVMYGSLLGLSEGAMNDRLDEILAFADIGDFIDQPLRTYSTGMTARLAFAVATNVDPAVLVVDEALAVGDGAFQKKCVDRMVALKRSGRTILFCSHSMYWVTSFCERAMWLRSGRIQAIGPAVDVVQEYERYLMRQGEGSRRDEPLRPQPETAAAARLSSVAVEPLGPRPAQDLAPGDGVAIVLEVETLDASAKYNVGVLIEDSDGRRVFGVATHLEGIEQLSGSTRYRVTLRLPALPLAGGSFMLAAFLLDDGGLAVYDQVVLPVAFTISGRSHLPMLLELDHEWQRTDG